MAGGKKILDGLREARDAAALAARVAVIIQNAREEDVTATRTAYRILGELGLVNYVERPVPAPTEGVGETPHPEGGQT